MAWVYLLIAGLVEIGWAVTLKYTEGFTRLWPSLVFLLTGGANFFLLSLSLRTLPVGTAYAVWTGIGAAGTAIVGILFLEESADLLRVVSIFLIVAGVMGLRLASSGAA